MVQSLPRVLEDIRTERNVMFEGDNYEATLSYNFHAFATFVSPLILLSLYDYMQSYNDAC